MVLFRLGKGRCGACKEWRYDVWAVCEHSGGGWRSGDVTVFRKAPKMMYALLDALPVVGRPRQEMECLC